MAYIRAKVDELLALLGTQPLRAEALDDATLLELDPIGIVTGAFRQVLHHLNETNRDLAKTRSELRAILDGIEAAVVAVDAQQSIVDCNRLALEWFFSGARLETVLGQPLPALCRCATEPPRRRRPDCLEEFEFSQNGRHFQAVVSRIATSEDNGELAVYLFFDVSRLRGAETRLRLFARVFEHSGEGILITDRENRIIEANAAFCRISGYPLEELIGKNPRILRSGLHDAAFYQNLWQSLMQMGYWKGEICNRTRDGEIIPLLQTISVLRDARGEVSHHIAIATDISHIKEAQSRLDFLAHHDALTGLPNRLLFNDRLEQAVARAKRDADMFALLFIDLDHFKTINDSLGHHVGDLLLIEVARRLTALTRNTDTVARLGGDEFVVLMEHLTHHQDAVHLAEKILLRLRQPYFIETHELHPACSIGLALFPEDGLDAVALLKNADASMYRAKEAGRGGYFRYQPQISEEVETKLSLEGALRAAIRQEAFKLHYQPIFDIERGRITACEALIRWPGSPQGMGPDRFIPVAEETRMILPLGEWVLREALQRFHAWREDGFPLDYVSVNLSAVQLAQNRVVELIRFLLDDCGVAGEHLQLELTENVLMRDMERSLRVLGTLRESGVRVAIDDFGTGYSSLAYLKALPIDNLKIDRSFVRDLPGDANDAVIASAIVNLAHSLGLSCIAEGVETREQEVFLRDLGCRYLQGYRYARPLPAEDFLTLLRHLQGGEK